MSNRTKLVDEKDLPAGYEQELWTRLLLPPAVKNEVEIAHMELDRRLREAQKAEHDARMEAEDIAPPKRRKTSREKEVDELLQLPVADPVSGEKHRFRLIDIEATLNALIVAIQGTVADESRGRLIELYHHLAATGGYRILRAIPDDWKSIIDQMMHDFPNFRAPLNYLRSMLAFSAVRDGTIHFEPLLFNGPSGIGKTYFCRTLARLLGCEFKLLQMEQQQESSALTGSSKFWSNTDTGVVFETLIHGQESNFLFMVDEVDKPSTGEFDPLAGLYGVLERNTAREYVDQSHPYVKMDASRVLWVMTSNALDAIPLPIRNRLRVFEIEAPTPAEMRGIVGRIFTEICDEQLGGRRMQPLGDPVIDRLLELAPRRIRPALAEAIGMAIYQDRHWVLPDDIQETVERRNPIGFTPGGRS